MNYFNYFSQCDKKAKGGIASAMKGVAVIVVLLMCIEGGAYGYYAIQAAHFQEELNILQQVEANAIFAQQLEAAKQTKELLTTVDEDAQAVEQLNRTAQEMNRANLKLANAINACMTDGYIKRISVSETSVTLEGSAKDVATITAIEKKFRESDVFSDVHISVIQNKGEAKSELPSFTCQLTLKGGAPKS